MASTVSPSFESSLRLKFKTSTLTFHSRASLSAVRPSARNELLLASSSRRWECRVASADARLIAAAEPSLLWGIRSASILILRGTNIAILFISSSLHCPCDKSTTCSDLSSLRASKSSLIFSRCSAGSSDVAMGTFVLPSPRARSSAQDQRALVQYFSSNE